MSIINDTLKSLEEKRRREESCSQESVDAKIHSSLEYARLAADKKRSLNTYLWVTIAVGCVALAALGWGLIHHAHDSQHHRAQEKSSKVLEKSTPLQDAKKVSVMSVHKLTIKNRGEAAVISSSVPQEKPSLRPEKEVASADEKPSMSLVMPSVKNKKATPHLENGELANDFSEAVDANDAAHFNVLVKKISTQKDWRHMLAVLIKQLEEGSHFVAAEHLLSAFRKIHPADIPLRMNVAHLYLNEGNARKAAGLLQSKHIQIEQHTDYYALLAYAFMKEKYYKDSALMYEQLVSIDSSEATWWMGLGVSYLYLDKPHDALESFERALAHADPHAPYRYFISQKIHLLSGDQA